MCGEVGNGIWDVDGQDRLLQVRWGALAEKDEGLRPPVGSNCKYLRFLYDDIRCRI